VKRAARPAPGQRRTLVRTRDVAAFRSALIDRALDGGVAARRRRVLILPTRASIEVLRQSIEAESGARGWPTAVLPSMATRDEWIGALHRGLAGARPMLGATAREVIFARAARHTEARSRMPGRPFRLRPGLVSEILRFYDALKLRQRSVRRFARALFDELRVERGTDRGSESLIHQTAFLGFAFLAYERAVSEGGVMDEHTLRGQLLREQPSLPFDHVVVAVADRSSDLRGLWPADFDLLGRLHAVAAVDVVMTDETHDAGFRDRLERELPGIVEARFDGAARAAPVLVRPPITAGSRGPSSPLDPLCFVSRDREEELRDVVRDVRGRAAKDGGVVDATAVVFQRPLPYLYLAEQVLADGGVPYQAFDTLPLAAEPFAAALDLVLAVARTGGTRESVIALLRSPLMHFESDDGTVVERADAAALDATLSETRASGDASAYLSEVEAWFGDRDARSGWSAAAARRAASAASIAYAELAPFRAASDAVAQTRAISGFLRRHFRPIGARDPLNDRSRRARAAVLGSLDALADALGRFDPIARPHDELAALIHHVIESRTFAPGWGRRGIHVLDSVAARFGDFKHVHLVGLVDTDWPERARTSILYTAGLLKPLGWPQAAERAQADQAAFRDLLRLASETTQLHAFQLEGDAVVGLSSLIESARSTSGTGHGPKSGDGSRLREQDPSSNALRPASRSHVVRIFDDEILTAEPPTLAQARVEAARWLAARVARPPLADPRYSGTVGPRPPETYRVSRVDRYVDCPFKYFAENVLGLPEERDELSGLTPLERGNLVHELFERFYRDWHADGQGAITEANLPDALARFARLTAEALSKYPEPDRVLEETRLLGSIVARGIAERVFELEADEGGAVTDRLVEFDLRGPFEFPLLGGMASKTIGIRGKADRIDIFDDGSLRVVDYKLSRLPDVKTSIQIAVYAHCARQALEARDGRSHAIASAVYLAFGDERKFRDGFTGRSGPAGDAVQARAGEFAKTIQRIEAGEFPPSPQRTDMCRWCGYAGVCRKEYRVEDHASAEPV